jgi:hypothetical protein
MRSDIFKRNKEAPESSPDSQRKTQGSRNSRSTCRSSPFVSSIFGSVRKGDCGVDYHRGSSAIQPFDDMLACQKDCSSSDDLHGQYYPVPPPVCFSESFMVQPIGHCSSMKHPARDNMFEAEYRDLSVRDDDHYYHVPPAACFCKSFMVQPLAQRNEYHI